MRSIRDHTRRDAASHYPAYVIVAAVALFAGIQGIRTGAVPVTVLAGIFAIAAVYAAVGMVGAWLASRR